MNEEQIPSYVFEPKKGWEEAAENHANLDLERLTLATYNIWFGEYCLEERAHALLDLLRKTDAHVMALQEVTAPVLHIIKTTEWIRNDCYLSDCHGLTFERYGTLLISRLPFRTLKQHLLPSLMDRTLLVGEFRVASERLLVATVHLESTSPMARQRIEQLNLIFPLLRHGDSSFLMGDFNFHPSGEEQEALDDRYLDLWSELSPQDPGYSEDTHINRMLFRFRGKPKKVRYDRIFMRCKEGAWQPRVMEILGTAPISGEAEQVFISDHFGLRASLTRSISNPLE